jgi:three-Cys-motif partner protein
MERVACRTGRGRRVTLPPIERYAGREQAYVKHYFLSTYIERLVHKVARSFDQVVYVDGFSGPWQSAGQDFSDTSFGIALNALRSAKTSWSKLGRQVQMKALLVEKSPKAFKALEGLQEVYPDVEVKPFNADFRIAIDRLLLEIPTGAFTFLLIDPKGWRISMKQIAPLLRRPNSEVLFNFMFEFVNRAASMSATATVAGLNELLPIGQWRENLARVGTGIGEDRATLRKTVLIEAFRQVLRELGDYRYVAEVPVLRPVRNRMLYSLVYATRSATGIEVFRDCQIKTLTEQDAVRIATKAKASGTVGQGEMFGTPEEMGPDLTQQFLRGERTAAERALIEIAPLAPASIPWDQLWPQVLALNAVRRTELNNIAAKLRRDGRLLFPDWEVGKRVPQAGYRVQRT